MSQNLKAETKNLVQKYGIRPSKGLGQNFLIDRLAAKKVIKASNLKPGDVVLEIGPGSGILTKKLAKKAKRVVAVEKDKSMVKLLGETLRDLDNVETIQGDILKIRICDLIGNCLPVQAGKLEIGNYKVVANLPFYLTAPVIRKFLEMTPPAGGPPKELVLIIQKEVGQRICAKAPKSNLLAVSVQFYAKPEIISYISKKSFWPQPKVDSCIIKITPLINTDKKLIDTDLFFGIVRAGFSQPRKQLLNNFSKGLKRNKESIKSWLLESRIKPTSRAETLNIKEWINLAESYKITQ